MSGFIVFAVVPTGMVSPATLPPDTALPAALRLVEGRAFSAIGCPAPAGGLAGLERGALLPWLLAAQSVTEHLMTLGTALPVSLGSVIEDEARLAWVLRCGAPVLRAAFEAVLARREMNLSVRWPIQSIVAETLATLPAEMKADAAAGAQAARAEVARRLELEIAGKRGAIRRRIAERLEGLTADRILTLPADPAGVVDLALLLDPAGEGRLDEALEALDAEFGGRLTFRLVGPLAPYSFATVHLTVPTRQQLASARALLGVSEGDAPEAVTAAYRRAARRVHQDLAAVRAEAGAVELSEPDEMVVVTQAYRTLRAEREPITVKRQETQTEH